VTTTAISQFACHVTPFAWDGSWNVSLFLFAECGEGTGCFYECSGEAANLRPSLFVRNGVGAIAR
jgi:hypothetical protein